MKARIALRKPPIDWGAGAPVRRRRLDTDGYRLVPRAHTPPDRRRAITNPAAAPLTCAARTSPWRRAAELPLAGIECAYARGMLHGFRVIGLIICAGLMAACASSRGAQNPTDTVEGRQVFFTQCYGCHTLGVAGTPIAPDLSRIGARLSRDEIERRLRDPRTHKPTARMPQLDLSEAEIGALATYLSELR